MDALDVLVRGIQKILESKNQELVRFEQRIKKLVGIFKIGFKALNQDGRNSVVFALFGKGFLSVQESGIDRGDIIQGMTDENDEFSVWILAAEQIEVFDVGWHFFPNHFKLVSVFFLWNQLVQNDAKKFLPIRTLTGSLKNGFKIEHISINGIAAHIFDEGFIGTHRKISIGEDGKVPFGLIQADGLGEGGNGVDFCKPIVLEPAHFFIEAEKQRMNEAVHDGEQLWILTQDRRDQCSAAMSWTGQKKMRE
nr:hypothetical protein [Desulfovibrio ferrophilus]